MGFCLSSEARQVQRQKKNGELPEILQAYVFTSFKSSTM